MDTAEEILAEAGGQPVELFLVIGADLVPELGSWHRAEDLQRLVTLAIVSRPTGPAPAVPPGWRAEWVDGPQVPVSSSEVRGAAGGGRLRRGHGPRGGHPLHPPPRSVRCALNERHAGRVDGAVGKPPVGALPDRVQRRADRRAELKLARRSRRRWAVAAGSILVGSFAFTVGMLELLH